MGGRTWGGTRRSVLLQVLSRPSNSLFLLFDELHRHLVAGPRLQHLENGVVCGSEERAALET